MKRLVNLVLRMAAAVKQAGGRNVQNASGKSRAAGAADAQRARSAEYIKRNWLVKRACI
jgi:hypothetical protein